MLPRRSTRRTAFSLLEVSLVVVIIFLLILALLPAFRGKRSDQRFPIVPRMTPTPEPHAPKRNVPKPGVPVIPLTTPQPAAATPEPTPK